MRTTLDRRQNASNADSFLFAVFDGWSNHLLARGNKPPSINDAIRHVLELCAFVGERRPWDFSKDDVDRWSASLVLRQARNTVRAKQTSVRGFFDFATNDAYPWNDACYASFGKRMVQLCTPENTVAHLWKYEGDAGRRAFSPEEERHLFAGLRARYERILIQHKKGALVAARDYAMFALYHGSGARCNEGRLLELFDFSTQPDPIAKTAFGHFGVVTIRHAKSKRGGAERRRQVLTVPLLSKWVAILRWYLTEIRPQFACGDKYREYLWLSERGTPLCKGYPSKRFAMICRELGFSGELTLHSLRHTYATRLLEDGYPYLFVMDQLGHEDPSTLGVYTTVGDDFRRRVILAAIARALPT